MTSAAERLRALLDERGVEYETYVEQPTGFEHVKWNFGEHGSADFNLEFGEPWLTMYGVISGPEQAIAATLGRGTCRNISDPPSGFLCSECGWGDFAEPSHLLTTAKYANNDGGPRFCPNCGKRVVEVDE